jgi:hypothetical protein
VNWQSVADDREGPIGAPVGTHHCRAQAQSLRSQDYGVMYKLIALILAAIPVVLFLRGIFTTQSLARSKAVSNFKRQVDYLVWAVLILIGCEIVYLIGSLVLG